MTSAATDPVQIIGLQPAHVAEVWPLIKWAFDSFAERGNTPAHMYLADVLEGRRQCWVVRIETIRAVALTTLTDKTVELTHCAGQGREDWQVALVNEVRAWGKANGAKTLMAYCRPGWVPMLKEQGLRETHRVMEQAIV